MSSDLGQSLCRSLPEHGHTLHHKMSQMMKQSGRGFEPITCRIPCEKLYHRGANETHARSTCDNFPLLNKIHSRNYAKIVGTFSLLPTAQHGPTMTYKGEENCQCS